MRRVSDRIGYIVSLILSISAIVGLVYGGVSKCNQWDENTMRIKRLEPEVWASKANIQEIKTLAQAQNEEIIRRLVRMENKIDSHQP